MQSKLTPPEIDERLMSAALFVRGGVMSDVGTDHAYLPARLILDGKIKSAVASDICDGPLNRAARTVEKYRLEDKITLVRTDGLTGIDKYRPQDIAIFGMGGEMIASIIDAAGWVRNPGIRLILQPMTKRSELRKYLLSHGFDILDEAMSQADGRIYQTICAEFRGVDTAPEYSVADLLIGKHNIARGGDLTKRYAAQLIDIYKARRDGKAGAGANVDDENIVLTALEKLIMPDAGGLS